MAARKKKALEIHFFVHRCTGEDSTINTLLVVFTEDTMQLIHQARNTLSLLCKSSAAYTGIRLDWMGMAAYSAMPASFNEGLYKLESGPLPEENQLRIDIAEAVVGKYTVIFRAREKYSNEVGELVLGYSGEAWKKLCDKFPMKTGGG